MELLRVSTARDELTWIKNRALTLISDNEMGDIDLDDDYIHLLNDVITECKRLLDIVESFPSVVKFNDNDATMYGDLISKKSIIHDLCGDSEEN